MPAQNYNGNRALEDYVGVHTRIEQFRAAHPAGRILTSIISTDPLTFRAEVYFTDSDVPNATGHASEEGGMGNRAKSACEKTETAAVGRALAFCGYEVKAGIASREEVERAEQQPATKPALAAVKRSAPTPATQSLDNHPALRVDYGDDDPNREAFVEADKRILRAWIEMGKDPHALHSAINKKFKVGDGLGALSLDTKVTFAEEMEAYNRNSKG